MPEDQRTLVQVDNKRYDSPENKEIDTTKRIVFVKFEGDKRYRFIGVYGNERRIDGGFEYTRLGTKFDISA